MAIAECNLVCPLPHISPLAILHDGVERESSRIHLGADGRSDGIFSFNVIFELLHQIEIQSEVADTTGECEQGLESGILKLLFVRPSD